MSANLVNWAGSTTRWSSLAVVFFLSACASYHPAPLATGSTDFDATDLATLSDRALKIDRPSLAPQTIDLSKPLSPNALAVIAVLENPDLKAQRAAAGVADAQAFAARLLPDPTLALGFDKLLSGPDTMNALTAALGFDLKALRTGKVVRESAEAQSRQVRLDLAWSEWQVAGQARLLGVRLFDLKSQLEIARVSAANARNLFDHALSSSAKGDISAAEADARRQALLDATAVVRTLETNLAATRGDLYRLLGLPPEIPLQIAPPPLPPVPPDAPMLIAQALQMRLDLQALRAGYQASEANLHKAVLDQFPNLGLTVTRARDTGGNQTLGPAVDFSLPLWNRNRGGIAVAKATREQLRAEYRARVFQTRAEISSAVEGLEIIRKQKAEIEAQLPASERLAEAMQRSASRGDVSVASAQTAKQVVRDRRLSLLQLEQQAAEQGIALELLTGELSEGWPK